MRMRLIIVILASLYFLPARSQAPLSYGVIDVGQPAFITMQRTSVIGSPWNKHWQLSSFAGLNAGCGFNAAYGFFHPGNIAMLSAPVGLQLTRKLNTNWYAFARVSAAPGLMDFNSAWRNPALQKAYTGNMLFNPGRFSVYSAAEAGFLYVNDEKTFSISGSIRVDRSSYPAYPFYKPGMNTAQPLNSSL